jgi:hypothetical protein
LKTRQENERSDAGIMIVMVVVVVGFAVGVMVVGGVVISMTGMMMISMGISSSIGDREGGDAFPRWRV